MSQDHYSLEQNWLTFEESFRRHTAARAKLLKEMGEETVEVLRVALLNPGQRNVALDILWHVPTQLKQELLHELLILASFQNGSLPTVRAHIRTMPRAWILAVIDSFAEEILSSATDDEPFRRLLELYHEIDSELTLRLAQRARSHHDIHVREAGEDFLSRS
jgi:hypothetical protein